MVAARRIATTVGRIVVTSIRLAIRATPAATTMARIKGGSEPTREIAVALVQGWNWI
jgi:hypothetical protein